METRITVSRSELNWVYRIFLTLYLQFSCGRVIDKESEVVFCGFGSLMENQFSLNKNHFSPTRTSSKPFQFQKTISVQTKPIQNHFKTTSVPKKHHVRTTPKTTSVKRKPFQNHFKTTSKPVQFSKTQFSPTQKTSGSETPEKSCKSKFDSVSRIKICSCPH